MFKSKVRPINIPQSEHGRLAGIFASLWGNEGFDRPVIDFSSFVQGVALHDWHYGLVDNLPIHEASEADWLKMARKGVEQWFDDPITDIVAKLHLRRLLKGRKSSQAGELIGLIPGRFPCHPFRASLSVTNAPGTLTGYSQRYYLITVIRASLNEPVKGVENVHHQC